MPNANSITFPKNLHRWRWLCALATVFAGCCALPRHSQTLTQEQKAAAEKMLASAQAGYRAFSQLGNARPGRPDLIDLQIEWSRKILAAELLLHPTEPERREAIEAHKKRLSSIAVGTGSLTAAANAQIDNAIAEADYFLASKENAR